eukprot:1916071-Amphidinium_carterae.1
MGQNRKGDCQPWTLDWAEKDSFCALRWRGLVRGACMHNIRPPEKAATFSAALTAFHSPAQPAVI